MLHVYSFAPGILISYRVWFLFHLKTAGWRKSLRGVFTVTGERLTNQRNLRSRCGEGGAGGRRRQDGRTGAPGKPRRQLFAATSRLNWGWTSVEQPSTSAIPSFRIIPNYHDDFRELRAQSRYADFQPTTPSLPPQKLLTLTPFYP